MLCEHLTESSLATGSPLQHAKVKAVDHRFDNHRIFTPLVTWLLNESSSDLVGESIKLLELFKDSEDRELGQNEEALKQRKQGLKESARDLVLVHCKP